METHKCDFGSNVISRALLVIVSILAFGSGAGACAQTGPVSDRAVVAKSNKRFAEYQQDFVQFARASSGDEYEVAMDLSTIAAQAGDYMNAVLTLLNIYDDVSCKEDQEKIRPVIEADVRFYSKNLEVFTQEANLGIAHTKMPGVAAEGTRMRDDLREAKSILDSIKLQ